MEQVILRPAVPTKFRKFRGQSKNLPACVFLSYILRVFTLTPPVQAQYVMASWQTEYHNSLIALLGQIQAA